MNAPTGTTLANNCGTVVIDESSGMQDILCGGNVTQSNGGDTDTIHLDTGGSIGPGDSVVVLLSGVTNPPAASYPASNFSVSTSSDTTPASPASGATLTSAAAPSPVSLTESTTAGGAIGATWSYSFVASGSGALDGPGGATITANAPSGTLLPGN